MFGNHKIGSASDTRKIKRHYRQSIHYRILLFFKSRPTLATMAAHSSTLNKSVASQRLLYSRISATAFWTFNPARSFEFLYKLRLRYFCWSAPSHQITPRCLSFAMNSISASRRERFARDTLPGTTAPLYDAPAAEPARQSHQ